MVTDTQVKTGYKQSELGVIPSDWEYTNLGLVCSYKNGKSFESNIDKNGNFNLITLDSIDITGKLKKEHLKVKTNDNSLGKNDIIMILSDVAHGNFLGLTDVIPEDNRYVLNQRVGALKNIKEFLPHYLSRYINLRQKYFKRVGQGSNQQNLAKGDVLAFPVLKPSLSEQEKIMDVLSNIEKLVEKTDQLIEKKRNIKQGTMQQLLTGKRRLPGFSGEWEEKQIRDLADIVSGGTPKTAIEEYWNGDILWCTPTDITNCDPKWINSTEKTISRLGLQKSSANMLPKGSLLLCSRATIGELRIATTEITTNQGFKSLVCHSNVDNEFLYYYILTIKNTLIEKANGSTFLEISKKDLQNIILFVPKKEEQKAIAEVLATMDEEIMILEKQKNKYLDVKQGMMQQLLTGRIRLV